jgi:hypothetical protein
MGDAVGPAVQGVVAEVTVIDFYGGFIPVNPRLLLKTIGNRLLDIFFLKFVKIIRGLNCIPPGKSAGQIE